MDSRTGKRIRLGRILRPQGRKRCGRGYVARSLDRPPPAGQRTRNEITRTFDALSAADAVMVALGMLRVVESFFIGRDAPGLVVEMDWKSWNRPIYTPLSQGRGEGTVASLTRVEDLVAAGVDGLMTYLYMGQLDQTLEREEIVRNATLARECERRLRMRAPQDRSCREHGKSVRQVGN